MTVYATTGPSRITKRDAAHAVRAVEELTDVTAIVTGGASGWDIVFAAAGLDTWPKAEHKILVPDAAYDSRSVRQLEELAQRQGSSLYVVTIPRHRGDSSSDAYRRRNQALVDFGDVLVAAVRKLVFYRSGEWMTANMALRAGRPVSWVDLAAPAPEPDPG